MRKLDANSSEQLDARQIRKNPGRYFHVMTKGWFIFTREGVKGPFYDKGRAAFFLQQHISTADECPGPGEAWR